MVVFNAFVAFQYSIYFYVLLLVSVAQTGFIRYVIVGMNNLVSQSNYCSSIRNLTYMNGRFNILLIIASPMIRRFGFYDSFSHHFFSVLKESFVYQ